MRRRTTPTQTSQRSPRGDAALLPLDLLTGREYFDSLRASIVDCRSGDRISLLTMGFDPDDDAVAGVLRDLAAAAARGVKCHLGIDAFGMLAPCGIGPWVMPPPYGRRMVRRRQIAIECLAAAGVECAILNEPRSPLSNYLANRCHIKLCVIGSRIFLAGPNFEATDRIDLAIGFSHQPTAHVLAALVERLMRHRTTRASLQRAEFVNAGDPRTRVIVDGGHRHYSSIREHALAAIDGAQEWITLGSQYFPSGATSRALVRAQERGVPLHLVYSHPSHHKGLVGAHYLIDLIERMRKPAVFFAHRVDAHSVPFHMTALATESVGIVTSMNFVDIGVRWGTSEIALIRHDPSFASAVHAVISSAAPAET